MPGNLTVLNKHTVSTKQQRIATLAQRSPEFAFFSLAHYIDLPWLEEAYRRTRKGGSAGIDDVTGKQYAENLHDNLQNLLERLKSGTYKAPPVKRKHIPKAGYFRPSRIHALLGSNPAWTLGGQTEDNEIAACPCHQGHEPMVS